MDIKLTLKLDGKVIERAKKFAKNSETSLSQLIENYLKRITAKHEEDEEITPLVKSLSGIVKTPIDENGYAEYLKKKYS